MSNLCHGDPAEGLCDFGMLLPLLLRYHPDAERPHSWGVAFKLCLTETLIYRASPVLAAALTRHGPTRRRCTSSPDDAWLKSQFFNLKQEPENMQPAWDIQAQAQRNKINIKKEKVHFKYSKISIIQLIIQLQLKRCRRTLSRVSAKFSFSCCDWHTNFYNHLPGRQERIHRW